MSETPVSIEQRPSAGDPIPRDCEVIEIHVTELLQLFNAIDPSPFRERDLDPAAEDFIVGWAREAARDARLALVVYLDRPAGLPEEAAILRDGLGDFAVRLVGEGGLGQILRESLVIGGWVAMWRPMEIFLYDWWPIRAEARLADRLAAMPVRIVYKQDASSEAWRWDWPAASPRSAVGSKPEAPQDHAKSLHVAPGKTSPPKN